MNSLCEDLPYWEFENTPRPHLILADGALSSGLEVQLLDINCFDEARVNQVTQGLRSFVNSLPEEITLQFLLRVETDFGSMLEHHRELARKTQGFLRLLDDERTNGIAAQIEAGALFRPKLYLSLKTDAPKSPGAFSFSQTKKFSSEFARGYEDRLQALIQAVEMTEGHLSGLGFGAKALQRDEMIRLVYQFLNPRRAAELPGPSIRHSAADLGEDSPRNQLVFSDLVLDREDFILDGMRTRVLTLKTLPEMTFAGMMNGFLSFPFKYEILFSFHVPDQAKEIRALEQKRRMAHSLAHSTSNRVSDLESESRLSQTTDLIREIIETGQRVFQAELVVVLREPESPQGRKALSLHTKEVLSRFKSLSGSEGLQETVGAWKVFRSELPLAPAKMVRVKKIKTNNLADFLPLFGAGSGDTVPVNLLGTRYGGLYSFNHQSSGLANFNCLVTGSSGGGKSVANNLLTLQQVARGVKVFVIDVGNSYKKMTEILGGQYFEINLSESYAINPFELRDPSAPPTGEKLKSLVNIIEQMIADEGEKLLRFDRVLIEQTLEETFATARSANPPRSPLLSDFARHCGKSSEAVLQRVGKLLFPWIGDSPFGRLLDRPGQIRADSPVVAFDLRGLSQYPDLQSVMILILTGFILDQVESDKTSAKRVLLDEAWALLKSPAAAAFMEYAARTFRKTGSGITFITQGVEEIIASGIGPAIINNTATKLIMLQRGDTRILKEQLKLNSQELKLIQSLEQRKGVFSEGFLMAGESRQVIRFKPSPLEYWIATSDARDNAFLAGLLEKGLSLEAAIQEAATAAPFGVTAIAERRAA